MLMAATHMVRSAGRVPFSFGHWGVPTFQLWFIREPRYRSESFAGTRLEASSVANEEILPETVRRN